MGTYNQNVILTMAPLQITQHLIKRCRHTGTPTSVIEIRFDSAGKPLPLTSEDKEILKGLDGQSRLYIIGHSNKGEERIYNDLLRDSVDYKYIATLISSNVEQTDISGLRISLCTCYGAIDKNNELSESFAAKLHAELKKHGIIDIDLLAVTGAAVFVNSIFLAKPIKYIQDTPERELVKSTEQMFSAITTMKANMAIGLLQAVTEQNRLTNLYERGAINFLLEAFMLPIQLATDNTAAVILFTVPAILFFVKYYLQLQDLYMQSLINVVMMLSLMLTMMETTCHQAHLQNVERAKELNYERPFSKVLFSWGQGGEQVRLDRYKQQFWEVDTTFSLFASGKGTLAKEFQLCRTYLQQQMLLTRSAIKEEPLVVEILEEIQDKAHALQDKAHSNQ